MHGLEIAVLIGVALFAGGALAERIRVPQPLVLLVLGIALGFVPGLDEVELPPEVVLTLFLPALLYWESLTISTREARRNLRVILLSAIPLVIATAAAVALAGHLAGLPWVIAIVLGAIVAPTDATAVGPVSRLLPRRFRTTLRAESLINDGTALTIYVIALAAVAAEGAGAAFDFGVGTLRFLYAYGAGIAIGIAIAFVVRWARRLVRGRSLLENTMSVLTPFLAYLPAELVGASGVLSVVTAGLILVHWAPRLISARTRVQAQGFWQLASGLVNGALFLLVGLQTNRVLGELEADPMPVLGLGFVIALVVVGARLAWSLSLAYVIRAIDRRPVQRTMRAPWRQRLVSGWAGFRGAVSLAAALGIPLTDEWRPFRAQLIAITLVVIVFTLVVQGLTMPLVVRFARFSQDRSEGEEEALASRVMAEAGAAALEPLAARLEVPEETVEAVRRQYEENHARWSTSSSGFAGGDGSEGELRRAIIAKKREAVTRLRDRGEIDDSVQRRMQDRLDIEELRLSPVQADD